MTTDILWFSELGLKDLDRVGGKNASLGEMVQNLTSAGVQVPDGFATTADAYRNFLADSGLDQKIADRLVGLDTDDVTALAAAGQEIRALMRETPFLPDFEAQIRDSYQQLVDKHGGSEDLSWAVRSSATAEDLPDASFAGQQETFLNVRGIENILLAIKDVFASLYNDRAIAYRVHHKFEHAEVALSAGVQRMVRSDVGASGVMFTMDTESGFEDAVFVTSSYGLGEAVVQGAVNPDEFYVYKPALQAGRPAILKRGLGEKALQMTYTTSREIGRTIDFVPVEASLRNRFSLTDDDVEQLARHAVAIEKHYGRPMDIEWGKDGIDGGLYILQARPETVQSRRAAGSLSRFRLNGTGRVLVEGRAIGQRIGAGRVRILTAIDQMAAFKTGDVLVADMTDPDWEPIMKRASAIVTNRGGRTCHAAIIARELGIPAVVGTGDATDALRRRPRGDRLLRRRRDRPHLRGAPGLQRRGNRDHPAARGAGQGHDERRHPGAGVHLRAAAQPRRGPGPARIHHQPPDRHPPQGAAEPGRAAGGRGRGNPRADRRLRQPARLLHQAPGRGRGHHRRGVRAGTGDRADVRLQVQRVRQPDRRTRLRAARREPDDRLPRRVPVPGAVLPGLLRP